MKSWEDLQPRRKRGITEQVSAEIHRISEERAVEPHKIAANIVQRYSVVL